MVFIQYNSWKSVPSASCDRCRSNLTHNSSSDEGKSYLTHNSSWGKSYHMLLGGKSYYTNHIRRVHVSLILNLSPGEKKL